MFIILQKYDSKIWYAVGNMLYLIPRVGAYCILYSFLETSQHTCISDTIEHSNIKMQWTKEDTKVLAWTSNVCITTKITKKTTCLFLSGFGVFDNTFAFPQRINFWKRIDLVSMLLCAVLNDLRQPINCVVASRRSIAWRSCALCTDFSVFRSADVVGCCQWLMSLHFWRRPRPRCRLPDAALRQSVIHS